MELTNDTITNTLRSTSERLADNRKQFKELGKLLEKSRKTIEMLLEYIESLESPPNEEKRQVNNGNQEKRHENMVARQRAPARHL